MRPYFHQWQSSSALSYKSTTPHNSSIRSDEGLTLQTSAFSIFHCGTSTIINSFHKTKFLCPEIFRAVNFIPDKISHAALRDYMKLKTIQLA